MDNIEDDFMYLLNDSVTYTCTNYDSIRNTCIYFRPHLHQTLFSMYHIPS